jgi:hypothetical protein
LEEITSFYSFEEVPELAQALLGWKAQRPEPDAGVEKALVQ